MLDSKRIFKTQRTAVEKTIAWIENQYAQVRVTRDGITTLEKTNNLVVPQFSHAISRPSFHEGHGFISAPQLHIHNLIMNMTQDSIGKWKAVENSRIFNEQKLIQSAYQSYLFTGIKDIGYALEIRLDGKVEIAGIIRKLNELFSKRRKDIYRTEQKLLEKGVFPNASDGPLRNIAVLESRSGKNVRITEEELKASWTAQMYEKGFSVEGVRQDIETAIQKESLLKKSFYQKNEFDTLRFAANAITENGQSFKQSEILDKALSMSRGHLNIDDLEKAFNTLLQKREIIRRRYGRQGTKGNTK